MADVLKLALIGTDKVGREVPDPHPTDALITADLAERRLLLQAGARALYQLAGTFSEPCPDMLPAAPSEIQPACSTRASELLREMSRHNRSQFLLSEALTILQDAGLRLPAELLPEALEWKNVDRDRLSRVLGERGRWLTQLHPGWRRRFNTAGSAPANELDLETVETDWKEGTLAARKSLLARVRLMDADRARRWLAESWTTERADARVELLEVLRTGLTGGDEAWLQEALVDSSKKVRGVAIHLLARLPESALANALRSLGSSMLDYTPPRSAGLLKSLARKLTGIEGAGKLAVKPPQEFDKAWQKMGLEEKPPAGTGNREFWLRQVMELIPPAHWSKQFESTPGALIAAVAEDDFALPQLESWSTAVGLHPDAGWASALWDFWHTWQPEKTAVATTAASKRRGFLKDLFGMLDPTDRGQRAELLLQTDPALFSTAMEGLGYSWSTQVGQAALRLLRGQAANPTSEGIGTWIPILQSAAVALPAPCFDEALQAWKLAEQQDYLVKMWRRELDAVLDTVRLRKQFTIEVRGKT